MGQVWETCRDRRKSGPSSAGPMTWPFRCVETSETAHLTSGEPAERRRWDLNPRLVAQHTISSRADSAALALLRACSPVRLTAAGVLVGRQPGHARRRPE